MPSNAKLIEFVVISIPIKVWIKLYSMRCYLIQSGSAKLSAANTMALT